MSDTYHLSHELYCPNCNKLLDAATSIEKNVRAPRDGDCSICAYCYEVNMYKEVGSEITLVPAPDEMVSTLMLAEPELYSKLETLKSKNGNDGK